MFTKYFYVFILQNNNVFKWVQIAEKSHIEKQTPAVIILSPQRWVIASKHGR
jgi:hypothetical protein